MNKAIFLLSNAKFLCFDNLMHTVELRIQIIDLLPGHVVLFGQHSDQLEIYLHFRLESLFFRTLRVYMLLISYTGHG